MPGKLPVYRIPDFTSAKGLARGIHVVDLQAHRQKHAFVQAPHKHDFYLLLVVTSGQGSHTIDFTQHAVTPGSVFFLTPGQVHAWSLTEETEGTLLFFSPEFYRGNRETDTLRQFPFFQTWQHPPVLYATPETLLPVERLLEQMLAEYAQPAAFQPDALRAYLELLLIQLARLYPEAPAAPEENSWPFQLYQLETLVENHYLEHQPTGFYAQALHLSPKYLNELCKQNLGKTTTDLLQERLILEAKRLLTHSPHLNIAQVAQALGFEDNSYFSRFFKKQVQITPEQFRQKG
ncbi:helix-turn-helix domain-containing protein [Rufibacter sediminis]|uniref:Helix-turn-helix domain-containing protein n=1 Tax=Rufibacter sediminis TaxID=2762756 RepID=A0ABR6VT70_9BACT|nr:helix-turn-helix domain-containing protein [Rufibacter sediminis]MBC3540359.1 helix-turn-helix domain-containing protein [Rufibacter sediminis]